MTQKHPSHILTGTRIRERRLALSRRQADVARAAGISPAYLNLIEHNRRSVGADLAARLAAVLEVAGEELASGREEARISALREAAATSMVVVSSIALATMVSNHWLTPVWLMWRRRVKGEPEDLRRFVLNSRRLAILAVVGAGWIYHQASGGTSALAAMGLVAFSGMAQVLPAMLGGLIWRGGNRLGAYRGVLSGSALWFALIFLPSIGLGRSWHPFPETDPLAFAIFLSLFLNTFLFVILSVFGFPDPIERVQALSFVSKSTPIRHAGFARSDDRAEPLLAMARRIWGGEAALQYFQDQALLQGKTGYLPDMTPGFLTDFERRLAGTVGAATAHAMIEQVAGATTLTVADLMEVADEAQRAKQEAARLESAGNALERTARQLRISNEKLTELSAQKDAFLGQISHELRTPMTSIRASSEILMSADLPENIRSQFAGIIHSESCRLTRLLDDLLDLSVLESRQVKLTYASLRLRELLDRAFAVAAATCPDRTFLIDRDLPSEDIEIVTDGDRLLQVMINVICNARKYCDAVRPKLTVRVRILAQFAVRIDVLDNGSGIAPARQPLIFEKFSRLEDLPKSGGAGLGLAICKDIMAALGGQIQYLPGQGGAAFRITLHSGAPVRDQSA